MADNNPSGVGHGARLYRLVVRRGECLSGHLSQRWLASTKKCPERHWLWRDLANKTFSPVVIVGCQCWWQIDSRPQGSHGVSALGTGAWPELHRQWPK